MDRNPAAYRRQSTSANLDVIDPATDETFTSVFQMCCLLPFRSIDFDSDVYSPPFRSYAAPFQLGIRAQTIADGLTALGNRKGERPGAILRMVEKTAHTCTTASGSPRVRLFSGLHSCVAPSLNKLGMLRVHAQTEVVYQVGLKCISWRQAGRFTNFTCSCCAQTFLKSYS